MFPQYFKLICMLALLKEWILILFKDFSTGFTSRRPAKGRDYGSAGRINWILFLHFQFPDETENIQSPSAKERERLSLNLYSISVNKINNSVTTCKNFLRSQIEFSQFHPRPPRLSGSRWRAGGN
jgi:hypothetical protein